MVIEFQRRKRERRRLGFGETDRGRLLTFVVTERKGKIRFVTAFPMHQEQKEIYRGEEAEWWDWPSGSHYPPFRKGEKSGHDQAIAYGA
ncbi:MAG: hypothetical protein P4L56_26150 [Candidatus Sulfopaludibacter sp.]|nr:hypothetical protein [Candidatus Sulfopaludibacter sp.]